MICGGQIEEDRMDRQIEELPHWEKWGEIIKKDLEKYPYIDEGMKRFILNYTISAITDAYPQEHRNYYDSDKEAL